MHFERRSVSILNSVKGARLGWPIRTLSVFLRLMKPKRRSIGCLPTVFGMICVVAGGSPIPILTSSTLSELFIQG